MYGIGPKGIVHKAKACSYNGEVDTVAYIRNRTTTSIKRYKTPYEVWKGEKPNIEHLKVFGWIAYAHVPDSERQKLDKKAEKLRFVGYCTQSKGYRLLDENISKVFIRRDVIFNEKDFGHMTAKTNFTRNIFNACQNNRFVSNHF